MKINRNFFRAHFRTQKLAVPLGNECRFLPLFMPLKHSLLAETSTKQTIRTYYG